jgi:hypothetical protein
LAIPDRIAWQAGNCADRGMLDPFPVHANQFTAFKTSGLAMSACAKFWRFHFFIHSAPAWFFGLLVNRLSAAVLGKTAWYGVRSGVSRKISIGIAERHLRR